MSNIYQYGNTVRLQCEFRDFDDVLMDPSFIRVKVLDEAKNIIVDEIITEDNKLGTGVYFYDFTTEYKQGRYYYEWYGEIGDLPTLKRDSFLAIF